ncbi:variant erythrocyte surface antigen-1 family protein [Babesia caballi]|uniref:Variant erythrocyte surface antigen-1 family protein n=1 Tax=Babesia caballi TaxID=5871 RepID=A0AAV4LU79_BABCB|nr:variant erythrocyte surface antigen-1 family protein [Babesia caballi]
MSSGKTTLTIPPTNLKEAIDWVLRVSGKDNGQDDNGAIKGLAKEVKNLLDKDDGDVAQGILDVISPFIGVVTKGFSVMSADSNVKNRFVRSPAAFIGTFKGKVELVRDYGTAVDDGRISQLIDLLQKDVHSPGSGPITKLADGLKTFIGWTGATVGNDGIGKNGQYTSSYKKEVTWDSLKDNEAGKKTCALIFLGISPILFYTLLFLYWVCSDGTPSWKGDKLTSGSLKTFMEKMGFSVNQLDDSKQGSKVATSIGNTCFGEIKTAFGSGKPAETHYATVVKSLEESKNLSIHPETFPLSACHRIASPFFTPNDTYTLESTSPATPSFAGYSGLSALAGGAYGFNLGGLGTFMSALYPSIHPVELSYRCPSNLKEAIDWILRVTGKDGGGGTGDGAQQLASAVQELLNTAGVTKIKPEIKINQDLIDNLAEGLAMFIGYDNPGQSNNIGTDGIAVGKGGGKGPPLSPGESSSKGYKLTYDREKATWQSQVEGGGGDLETKKKLCAKIFLGCVPMIFSALSYLYWRCYEKGAWKNMTFWDSSQLQYFMEAGGFISSQLQGNGATVASALKVSSKFQELSSASQSASFAEFLTSLKKQIQKIILSRHSIY